MRGGRWTGVDNVVHTTAFAFAFVYGVYGFGPGSVRFRWEVGSGFRGDYRGGVIVNRTNYCQ